MSQIFYDLRTEDDVISHLRISQIEIAIRQTDIFPCLFRPIDFKRQIVERSAEKLDSVRFHLYKSRGDIRIDRLFISLEHRAVNENNRFLA